jgi:hypothetical protein
VGRVVHYVSHGTPVREDGTQAYTAKCRAAIVTEVSAANPDRVGLAVLNPSGEFFHPLASGGCVKDEAGISGGSWHWPERVQLALPPSSEDVARKFHEAYEELAPSLGYETREESRVPWDEVPGNNKALMIAVVAKLINDGVIRHA